MTVASLTNVTKECWFNIASFLAYSDLLNVNMTCCTLSALVTDEIFWDRYMKENFIPKSLLNRIVGVDNPRLLTAKLVHAIIQQDVVNVIVAAIVGSSVDNSAESPENTMTKSACLKNIDRARNLDLTQIIPIGFFSQQMCGCTGSGRPCYFSSAPSLITQQTEYITYLISPRPVFICGFTVTPYQAFFHPDAPVYAPCEVCIQFLTADRTVKPQPAQINRLTTEQLQEGVYFESPYYVVAADSTEQLFSLDRPQLCSDSTVRIVFKGMRQRQTLGPEFGEEYFMCISHCSVLAAPIEMLLQPIPSDGDSAHTSCLKEKLVIDSEINEQDALPYEEYELPENESEIVALCGKFASQHCIALIPPAGSPSLHYLFDNGDDFW